MREALKVEIKAAPGTNSGIFFRTPPMDKCDKYLNGSYEAQIQNDAKSILVTTVARGVNANDVLDELSSSARSGAKSKFLALDGKLLKLNTQSSHSVK